MAEEGPDKMGGGCGNDGQCGNLKKNGRQLNVGVAMTLRTDTQTTQEPGAQQILQRPHRLYKYTFIK